MMMDDCFQGIVHNILDSIKSLRFNGAYIIQSARLMQDYLRTNQRFSYNFINYVSLESHG